LEKPAFVFIKILNRIQPTLSLEGFGGLSENELMQTEFAKGVVGIRPYRPEDVSLLFAAARESVIELSLWMPWCRGDYSMEDSTNWVSSRQAAWEKDEEYSFVIFDVRNGAFLGGTGLNRINKDDKCANLGYWVRTTRTREGIASAAGRLMMRFGLQELGFNRMEIIAAVGNTPSQRVAEKIGAKREGLLRKRILLHGKTHDGILYSLVGEDFDS
jgi:ribosomal-protein-serine acetyltransferase